MGEINSVWFEFEFSQKSFPFRISARDHMKMGVMGWSPAPPLAPELWGVHLCCSTSPPDLQLLTCTASPEHPSLGKFLQGAISALSLGDRLLGKLGWETCEPQEMCSPAAQPSCSSFSLHRGRLQDLSVIISHCSPHIQQNNYNLAQKLNRADLLSLSLPAAL